MIWGKKKWYKIDKTKCWYSILRTNANVNTEQSGSYEVIESLHAEGKNVHAVSIE